MADWAKTQASGVLASVVVALAATFLSEHYGASPMLFALLLGMAVNFLSLEGPCVPGIAFAAGNVLRIGVALLGMRITLWQMAGDFGWAPLLVTAVSLVATILAGLLLARLFGFNRQFGLLAGGAVAICGASAALAIAAVLPHHEKKERAVIFTVIGVSALSTVAMVLYPIIAQWLHFDARLTGIFFGATIHDVAQVVGAGYGVSNETGDAATVVKLLRVFMLLPVILVISLVVRMKSRDQSHAVPLLPGFALAFAALVLINSTGLVPAVMQKTASELSRWCLVIAISAIGMKTRLKEMASVGLKPIVLMIGVTVFLMLLVIALITVIPQT
ncbi:MAG TPA: putative sulfate exporter family transporter [Burkholderiales bacterium]